MNKDKIKAFKAYDFRGVYNKDFDIDTVYKFGFFLKDILPTNTVLIGRDARISSPEIHQALCDGIINSGLNVIDTGLSTTPMIYWLTASLKLDASVQITASHNPPEYNGMKISGTDAIPIAYDNGLNKLEEIISNKNVTKSFIKGRVLQADYKEKYFDFLNSKNTSVNSTGFIIDNSNGMSGLFSKQLFPGHKQINAEVDGTFPAHLPNPLEEANRKQLQDAVIKEKAQGGIIFDGDADRVMFLDENGRFISPDLIIALLAKEYLDKQKGKILYDIRSSRAVKNFILKNGGSPEMWKVGRAFAARKLRSIDGIFGGELAGHYYFKEFYYSDSGLLACIKMLNLLSGKLMGKSLSSIIDNIQSYFNSGERNYLIKEKNKAMEIIRNHFLNREKALEVFDFDGYRLEFKSFWINIRPSNTEPYLRLIAEAESHELLSEIITTCEKLLKPLQQH